MSVLVVVAHPDDETIGAGATLAALRDACVVHLTNGAPRDRRWVSHRFEGSLEEYAAVRAAEARAALALAGVGDVRCLGCDDQEAIHNAGALAAEIAKLAREFETVLTNAYEGGHPDHDACALAVHRALPGRDIVEMPLYHARGGELVAGEFVGEGELVGARCAPLPEFGADGRVSVGAHSVRPGSFVMELDDEQRALKQRMFDCFPTQRDVLAQFPIARERFRIAPRYDFSRPPHEGPLWYEIAGFPIDGETWRRLACR